MSAVEMMFGMLRYERATGPGPTQNASFARATCSESRSASEKTATVAISSSRHARSTRTAISPRLAISTLRKMALSSIEQEQWLAVFDRRSVAGSDRHDSAAAQTMHRISNAERLDVR